MSEAETCETHVWASVGVVNREGTVCKIWECENCPVWAAEPFQSEFERGWEDTWLSER
jgi:hypothetical protein